MARFIRRMRKVKAPPRKYLRKNRAMVRRGMSAVGRVASLARNVAFLKSVVNAEKKETSGAVFNFAAGQVNGNSGVTNIYDLTPSIAQNVTGQGRIGNSVKLHSLVIKGQVLQQQNNHHQGRVKFMIFRVKGSTETLAISNFLELNPLNSLYDYNSPRALDTFKNYELIRTKSFNLQQDNYSGVQSWKDFTIPIKFKSHHIKYNDNNGTGVTAGQLVMICVTDSGNISGTTTSTQTNIPVTGINSGFSVISWSKAWYYDN